MDLELKDKVAIVGGEGRRIVRRLAGLLGEVEGLGGRAEARDIEQRPVERSASSAPA